MKNNFVPRDLSIKLKELGFDEPCLTYYSQKTIVGEDVDLLRSIIATTYLNTPYPFEYYGYSQKYVNDNHYYFVGYKNSFIDDFKIEKITAPLWQQAFDWFRKTFNIIIEIKISIRGFYVTFYNYYSNGDEFVIESLHTMEDVRTFFDNYDEAQTFALKRLIEINSK